FKGSQISLFTLKNSSGMQVYLTNYGARIVSILVPDKTGKLTDIVLGYNHIQDYLNSNEPYFGATVGRYCNRMSGGQFIMDGHLYELTRNERFNHIHGGHDGLHAVVWEVATDSENQVTFKYLSPDGEEGYPGNLNIKV